MRGTRLPVPLEGKKPPNQNLREIPACRQAGFGADAPQNDNEEVAAAWGYVQAVAGD